MLALENKKQANCIRYIINTNSILLFKIGWIFHVLETYSCIVIGS